MAPVLQSKEVSRTKTEKERKKRELKAQSKEVQALKKGAKGQA